MQLSSIPVLPSKSTTQHRNALQTKRMHTGDVASERRWHHVFWRLAGFVTSHYRQTLRNKSFTLILTLCHQIVKSGTGLMAVMLCGSNGSLALGLSFSLLWRDCLETVISHMDWTSCEPTAQRLDTSHVARPDQATQMYLLHNKQTYHQRHACDKLALPPRFARRAQMVCHQIPCQTVGFPETRQSLGQHGTDAPLSTLGDCTPACLHTHTHAHSLTLLCGNFTQETMCQILSEVAVFYQTYEGCPINKLQNGIIRLIFKIWKIRNKGFVRNLIRHIYWKFYPDHVINMTSRVHRTQSVSAVFCPFFHHLPSVNTIASYEYQRNGWVKQWNLFKFQTSMFYFFNILSKFIWTLIDTRRSDCMRDVTAASVVKTKNNTSARSFFINHIFSSTSKLLTPKMYCLSCKTLVTRYWMWSQNEWHLGKVLLTTEND